LLIALTLTVLLVGVVAAVEAAGGGAEHAMVTGVMAGDATDDGALDAALGVAEEVAAVRTSAAAISAIRVFTMRSPGG